MANENSIDSTWDFTAPDQDNLFSKFISEPLDLLAIPSTKTENFSNSSLDAALPSGGADFITDISDLVLPSDIFDLATERSLYDQVQQLAETVANVQEKFQEEVSLRKQENEEIRKLSTAEQCILSFRKWANGFRESVQTAMANMIRNRSSTSV